MMRFHYQVLYEDNHLLCVNKPAGYLSQGDSTGDAPLVEYYKDYIKEKYQKPGKVFLGVIHRLDRPVSGALIFARTSKALQRMTEKFREKEFQKTYLAVVKQKPPYEEATLKDWLVKDNKANRVSVYNKQKKGALLAELQYTLLGKAQGHYLLKVTPFTGRPHQIRAQLAKIGCSIRGDIKYGYPKPNEDASINLHALSQKFLHPVKKEPLHIQAPLPDDYFWRQFEELYHS